MAHYKSSRRIIPRWLARTHPLFMAINFNPLAFYFSRRGYCRRGMGWYAERVMSLWPCYLIIGVALTGEILGRRELYLTLLFGMAFIPFIQAIYYSVGVSAFWRRMAARGVLHHVYMTNLTDTEFLAAVMAPFLGWELRNYVATWATLTALWLGRAAMCLDKAFFSQTGQASDGILALYYLAAPWLLLHLFGAFVFISVSMAMELFPRSIEMASEDKHKQPLGNLFRNVNGIGGAIAQFYIAPLVKTLLMGLIIAFFLGGITYVAGLFLTYKRTPTGSMLPIVVTQIVIVYVFLLQFVKYTRAIFGATISLAYRRAIYRTGKGLRAILNSNPFSG